MRCIGLTGGIGSGKSYVAKIFQNLDVPIYKADNQARYISDNNPAVISKIVSLFGKDAYTNGMLNRQFIGGMVFDDSSLLKKLNEIIHPEVEKDFKNWCSENINSAYIIKEAAILFETGSYKNLHSNILVVAPEEIRLDRVKRRDKVNPDQIRKRMQNQWTDSKKRKLADYVIVNDGKSLILPQVIQIHNRITE